ncbi:MAG TPA: hypothetical protein V6C89_04460 [Drouetiella sp.]|jgi:hypothetical protein
MSIESFDRSDGGSLRAQTALVADFTNSPNEHFSRPVDQSLNFSSDNKSLIFSNNGLYPSQNDALANSAEFDKLNTHHSRDGEPETLSRNEITRGAYDIIVGSNTNGNNKVDLNEWLNVAPAFGFDEEHARATYAEGVKEAEEGKSLYEITKNLVTSKVMGDADTNGNGRIDRTEFDDWIDEVCHKHGHHPDCDDPPETTPDLVPVIPDQPPAQPPDVPMAPITYPLDTPLTTIPDNPFVPVTTPPIETPIVPVTNPTVPTDIPNTPVTTPITTPIDTPTPVTKPTPNQGTDLSSLFTAGDSGVTTEEMQHARDIANALPEAMKKALLANHVRLTVQSGFNGGAQGQNSGLDGSFYADSGMADQSEVHELYEMYGQVTSNGAGSWSDSRAVGLADSGLSSAGATAYNEGDLNDTVGNIQGDGDHMSNAFVADFFASHPGLLQDQLGRGTLDLVAQDDPNLVAYIAQSQGLVQA